VTDNVVKLHLVDFGDGARFDPDQMLEDAKGQGFVQILITGELPNGDLVLFASHGIGDAVFLLERAKYKLLQGSA
jgi:hypothetical protein